MREKLLLGVSIIVVIIALSAWSPWLTQSFAETRAVVSFNGSWSTVIDGCGTNCKGCVEIESKKVPFGMEITLEYDCGLIPEDTPTYHEQVTSFVSAFGTVHGYPKP